MMYFCLAWMGGTGRLGLILDELLFRSYRKTAVRRPVFIVGNFRSGSTLLHRLMASDPQFAAMKTWEIYFAPSISQRKFWHGFWMIDRLFGGHIKAHILRLQDEILGQIEMHRVNLLEAEEDEALLLYLWDSLFTWFFIPDLKACEPDLSFDQAVPRWRRRKIMQFYSGCLQRHLSLRPPGTMYVSKNPAFSSKLQSLLETFPDARFVYLVRHPFDVVASTASWFSFTWHYFSSPLERFPHRDRIVQMTKDWFEHPLRFFESLPADQFAVVPYEDLVSRPSETVEGIYDRLRIALSDEVRDYLSRLERRPSPPQSHSAGLDDLGLNEAEARLIYADVLRRHGYEV